MQRINYPVPGILYPEILPGIPERFINVLTMLMVPLSMWILDHFLKLFLKVNSSDIKKEPLLMLLKTNPNVLKWQKTAPCFLMK